MISNLRLFLFGMPRLEYQGKPVMLERRKALALLAYLASMERPQSREMIAALLWPNQDYDHARTSLRSTLHTLTTALSIDWMQSDRNTLAVKSDTLWVDVNAFVTLLKTDLTHGHGPEDVCTECAERFQEAIALYTADFMNGFILSDSSEYEDWQLTQREWLRREFAHLHRRLSGYFAQSQQVNRAIKHAQDWLVVDILHEPAHRQLMELYAVNGQRSEALRQYQQCTELLYNELVTLPDEETTKLYEAIQQNHFDASPAARSDPVPTLSGIMPPLPILTIGREEALREIKQRLGVGGSEMRTITVIQGWPGVGKSTTVALLAHDPEIAQQFPDGVLWTSLGENPSLLVEIATWADALMISEPDRASRIEDISAQLTAALRNRHMLLIVDDVWHIEHARPFRVGGQSCAMVITTRLNDVATGLAATASDVYRLPVLSEAAALKLLGNLTPETVAEYPNDARELVHNLEGLPLAIQVAGRLLHNEAHLGWGIRELLAELRTGAGLLQAQIPGDMLGSRTDASPTVAALLKRSTDLLNVETRRRFAYLGLFAPKPATFDLEAMVVVWDVDDPRPTARILVNRGLLEPISGGRFQMHALLVMHARALLEQEGSPS